MDSLNELEVIIGHVYFDSQVRVLLVQKLISLWGSNLEPFETYDRFLNCDMN